MQALTPREREVLRGAAEGKCSRVIALELGVSRQMVKQCRTYLVQRFGVRRLADIPADLMLRILAEDAE